MIQAYNFLASWQLFPERCTYEFGERPKSGTYKISSDNESHNLMIDHHWVTLENQAFHSSYKANAREGIHEFEDENLADQVSVVFQDGIHFTINFYKENTLSLEVIHEIQPNGYLKITQKDIKNIDQIKTNIEVYHKQMSVLPYAASVSGAVIKPTEEGVIRHKALTAMEEQTNMQLEQIRKQIELLALQAQEIQKRKELSAIIYGAKLSFTPVIGQLYYLYEKKDGTHLLSMVSPKEWGGGSGPFKACLASVKLLADHTWIEII